MTIRSRVEVYVRAIRNVAKRTYAEAYVRHVFDGAPYPDPRWDKSRSAYQVGDNLYLSYMACQAVRMQVDEIAGDRLFAGLENDKEKQS